MRRVRVHAEFRGDHAEKLRWIEEFGERSWVDSLVAGTRWVVRTLARFPALGVVTARKGSLVQRSIRYPEGPYVAWYIYDEDDPAGELVLVRLFHSRQERPEPGPEGLIPPST